jgi:hypothetical protein
MKAQALRPGFNVPITKVDIEVEKKGVSEEEIALYKLSLTNGWKILEEFMDGQLSELEDVNAKAVSSGLSFEEIGKNAMILIMTKGIIKRVKDKVGDAKEVCENE